ncbi:MAG: hypothetical protein ACQESE_01165 [Nanobdellota archaeon]
MDTRIMVGAMIFIIVALLSISFMTSTGEDSKGLIDKSLNTSKLFPEDLRSDDYYRDDISVPVSVVEYTYAFAKAAFDDEFYYQKGVAEGDGKILLLPNPPDLSKNRYDKRYVLRIIQDNDDIEIELYDTETTQEHRLQDLYPDSDFRFLKDKKLAIVSEFCGYESTTFKDMMEADITSQPLSLDSTNYIDNNDEDMIEFFISDDNTLVQDYSEINLESKHEDFSRVVDSEEIFYGGDEHGLLTYIKKTDDGEGTVVLTPTAHRSTSLSFYSEIDDFKSTIDKRLFGNCMDQSFVSNAISEGYFKTEAIEKIEDVAEQHFEEYFSNILTKNYGNNNLYPNGTLVYQQESFPNRYKSLLLSQTDSEMEYTKQILFTFDSRLKNNDYVFNVYMVSPYKKVREGTAKSLIKIASFKMSEPVQPILLPPGYSSSPYKTVNLLSFISSPDFMVYDDSNDDLSSLVTPGEVYSSNEEKMSAFFDSVSESYVIDKEIVVLPITYSKPLYLYNTNIIFFDDFDYDDNFICYKNMQTPSLYIGDRDKLKRKDYCDLSGSEEESFHSTIYYSAFDQIKKNPDLVRCEVIQT